MKIDFKKATQEPKEFEISHDSICFRGSFWKTTGEIVSVQGALTGVLTLACDRCAALFEKEIDESVVLKLANSASGLSQEELLDVQEIESGVIDFDLIMHDELFLIEGDYHYCKRCCSFEGDVNHRMF
jgi:uncharacterized metal-binding protein YceD (DUF177 family)